MFLFAGENDSLVAPADYQKLLSLLPSGIKSKVVADYNHLDYVWSADINQNINEDVKAFLASL